MEFVDTITFEVCMYYKRKDNDSRDWYVDDSLENESFTHICNVLSRYTREALTYRDLDIIIPSISDDDNCDSRINSVRFVDSNGDLSDCLILTIIKFLKNYKLRMYRENPKHPGIGSIVQENISYYLRMMRTHMVHNEKDEKIMDTIVEAIV